MWSLPRNEGDASASAARSASDRAARYNAVGHPPVRLTSVWTPSNSSSSPARRRSKAASAGAIARSRVRISTSARWARSRPSGRSGSMRAATATREFGGSRFHSSVTVRCSTGGLSRWASSITSTAGSSSSSVSNTVVRRPAATSSASAASAASAARARATRSGGHPPRPTPRSGPTSHTRAERRSPQALPPAWCAVARRASGDGRTPPGTARRHAPARPASRLRQGSMPD